MPNTALKEHNENAAAYGASTNLSAGEILRRTRIHYARSYQDVENALRIRAEQIQAIEEGNMDLLPARVYVLGFVRSYADYLGLDGEKMLALFKSQSHTQDNSPNHSFPASSKETQNPPLWMVAICVLVLIAGIGGVWSFSSGGNDDNAAQIPEVPASMKAQNGTQPPTNVAQNSEIHVKVLSPTKIELNNAQGETLVSRELAAGDAYALPQRADLTMNIDDFNAVEISVDGSVLNNIQPAAGTQNTRAANSAQLPLDPIELKKRYIKPVENLLQTP